MGLKCVFRNHEVKITKVDCSKVVMRGNREGNLYSLKGTTLEALVFKTNPSGLLDRKLLWHTRLGHLGANDLRELQKQWQVDIEIPCDVPKCESAYL